MRDRAPRDVASERSVEKTCAVCGRRIEWRRKWQRDWDRVRHCSSACRRRGRRPIDEEVERVVVDTLSRRARGATACPGEVARALASGRDEAAGDGETRRWLEEVRRAARRLVARGVIEILQGGGVVDPSTAKGPIRLRLRRR